MEGKINRGRHTDHPAGHRATSSGLSSAHLHHFLTGRMPFLQPNLQCQSTEGAPQVNTSNMITYRDTYSSRFVVGVRSRREANFQLTKLGHGDVLFIITAVADVHQSRGGLGTAPRVRHRPATATSCRRRTARTKADVQQTPRLHHGSHFRAVVTTWKCTSGGFWVRIQGHQLPVNVYNNITVINDNYKSPIAIPP